LFAEIGDASPRGSCRNEARILASSDTAPRPWHQPERRGDACWPRTLAMARQV